MSTLGPDFMPKVVSVGVFLLGCIYLIQSVRKYVQNPSSGRDKNTKKKKSRGELFESNLDWVSAVLIMLYVLSMGKLGFVLSSILYLFSQMYLLSFREKRNHVVISLIAIFTPILIYYVFTRFFYLMLPRGPLG